MRRAVAILVALVASSVAACTYTKDETEDTLVPTDVPVSSTTAVDPALATTTTVPTEADLGAVSIELREIVEVDQPTALAARAGDPALYVAEQGGRVRRVEITTTRRGTTETETYRLESAPALDLRDEVIAQGEQGLLGITFSTDGSRLYAAYTGTDSLQHLVEFTMGAEAVDRSSRRELLVVEDPFPNHNGGQVAFGPDGYLYWGMGDGGGSGDPERTGQDPADLLGAILRLDPDVAPEQRATVPYAIPNGNPFAAGGGAPEVWAYGLRNPWRFSFDRRTGDLWIGDVGQDALEEVDLLPADATTGTNAGRAANLGWPVLEGDQPFDGGETPAGAVPPIFTYGRADGACSVTGGYVYRGSKVPSLAGVYVFADYCEGRLRGITQRDGQLNQQAMLGPVLESPTSFGEDPNGELYVLSQAGPVYRIVTAG